MMLLAFATAVMTISSCKESDDYYFTAGEDDEPRILNTDIPESSGGAPSALPAISRDANFNFEVIVTPALYTTVDWFIDGELVYTGNEIDMPMLAGDYIVKIAATTNKGKSTYRNCSLQVLPLDGDPAMASDAQSRWCQIGTTKSISVTYFSDITAAYIGGVALTDFKNESGTITFTVPAMEEGDKKFVAETEDGTKYGCGTVYVSNEKYVAPGVENVVLFQGDKAVPEWTVEDSEMEEISNKMLELINAGKVKVGTPLTIEFERTDFSADGYCSVVLINSWWQGILTGKEDPNRGDITPEDGQTSISLELTETAITAIQNAGFFVTGHGYNIKKIYVECEAANAEKVLWEGNNALNWDAENIKVTKEEMEDVPVDANINIYYSKISSENLAEVYWALRITTPWWGDNAEDNILSQTDFGKIEEIPYTIVYDAHCKALVDERGAMCLVGNGLQIEKITWTK